MRIPFEIPKVDEVNKATGFLYLEEEFLVFEYHILAWSIVKGERVTVKAAREVIDDVYLEQRIFGDRLRIATRSVPLLREIPGQHTSAIELRIKKRYRSDVDAFIEAVLSWVDDEAG